VSARHVEVAVHGVGDVDIAAGYEARAGERREGRAEGQKAETFQHGNLLGFTRFDAARQPYGFARRFAPPPSLPGGSTNRPSRRGPGPWARTLRGCCGTPPGSREPARRRIPPR